ncbi:MAG: hypothetical protein WAV66_01650, partial [Anaerolineae bacterium]
LITRPHPDFTLEYAPNLRAELYRLSYGQPYLLQRLCWELVNHWNVRFLQAGEKTPRELTLADLAPLLTPDFYHAAGYYFDGVWSNITAAERDVLRVLAEQEEGYSISDLATATGKREADLQETLNLLRRHDVIVDKPGGVRFASELMRRWVVQMADTLMPTPPRTSSPTG